MQWARVSVSLVELCIDHLGVVEGALGKWLGKRHVLVVHRSILFAVGSVVLRVAFSEAKGLVQVESLLLCFGVCGKRDRSSESGCAFCQGCHTAFEVEVAAA